MGLETGTVSGHFHKPKSRGGAATDGLWAQSERRQCQARCRGLVLAHNPRAADSMGVRRLQRALCSVEVPADANLYAIPGATPLPVRHAHTSVAGHKEPLGATDKETAPIANPRTRLSGRISVYASFDLFAHAKSKVLCVRRFYKVLVSCLRSARALRVRSRPVEPTICLASFCRTMKVLSVLHGDTYTPWQEQHS